MDSKVPSRPRLRSETIDGGESVASQLLKSATRAELVKT